MLCQIFFEMCIQDYNYFGNLGKYEKKVKKNKKNFKKFVNLTI